MSTIQVGGQLQPGTVDTPLDARVRVDTLSAIASIPLPFVGMTFFVKATGKLYVVKSLKSKQIGPVVTENAAIDEYEELPRTWDDIPGKPETFQPADHEHTTDEITGLEEKINTALGNAAAKPATISLPVPHELDNENVTLIVDLSLTGEFTEGDNPSYARIRMSESYAKMRVFSNGSWEPVPGPSLGVPYYGGTVEFTLDTDLFENYVAGTKYYARYCWIDSNGNAGDWVGFAFRSDVSDMVPIRTDDESPMRVAAGRNVSGEITLDYLDGEVQNITLTDDASLDLDDVANVSFGQALVVNADTAGHTLTVTGKAGEYTCSENKIYLICVTNFGVLNIAVTETV